MGEKAPDRRTLKTKKAIRDAFAELLTEKELRKVSVQEIADKADINRATFYKHYLDVYDLYDKTEQEILVEIGMLVLRLGELSSDKFFSTNGKAALRAQFDKCMEGLFRQIESERLNIDVNDKKLLYQSCYRSQGCIAVISKWVTDNFSESKDFIVKTVSELDTNTEQLARLGPRKAVEKRSGIF